MKLQAIILRQHYGETRSQTKELKALRRNFAMARKLKKQLQRKKKELKANIESAEAKLLEALLDVQLLRHNEHDRRQAELRAFERTSAIVGVAKADSPELLGISAAGTSPAIISSKAPRAVALERKGSSNCDSGSPGHSIETKATPPPPPEAFARLDQGLSDIGMSVACDERHRATKSGHISNDSTVHCANDKESMRPTESTSLNVPSRSETTMSSCASSSVQTIPAHRMSPGLTATETVEEDDLNAEAVQLAPKIAIIPSDASKQRTINLARPIEEELQPARRNQEKPIAEVSTQESGVDHTPPNNTAKELMEQSQPAMMDGQPDGIQAQLRDTLEELSSQAQPAHSPHHLAVLERLQTADIGPAIAELEACETRVYNLGADLEQHRESYLAQYFDFFDAHPDRGVDFCRQEFGAQHLATCMQLQRHLSSAEQALKSACVAAKKAGVAQPNFYDQESGFLSAAAEGPNEAHRQWLIGSLDERPIRDWFDAPDKTSKLQMVEARFALAGAHVEPWESTSARGERGKRRKIDAQDANKRRKLNTGASLGSVEDGGESSDGDDSAAESDIVRVERRRRTPTSRFRLRSAKSESDLREHMHDGSANTSKEAIEHALIPPRLSRFSNVGRKHVSPSSLQILRARTDILAG
jgi:hypothetical protein